MKSGRCILLFILAGLIGLTCGPVCKAQPYSIRVFTTRDGLSSNHVTSVIQDSRDFLWIGTDNGLNRFDGYSFAVYHIDDFAPEALPDCGVRCLYEDSRGYIWIGLSDGHLVRYDCRDEHFSVFLGCKLSEIGKGEVSGIIEDSDGQLWITVDRVGLSKINPESGIIREFPADGLPGSLPHNATTAIVRNPGGGFWIGSWGGGICLFDPVREVFTSVPDNILPDVRWKFIKCLMVDNDGNLRSGSTYCGMFLIDLQTQGSPEEIHSASEVSTLGSNTVNCLAQNPFGRIIVGSADGIDIQEKDRSYHIKSHYVRGILSDRDGCIWAATDNGLLMANEASPIFGNALTWGSVSPMYTKSTLVDRDGDLWVIADEGLFRVYKNQDGEERVEDLNEKLQGRFALSLYEDREGDIWIGYHGDYLFRYRKSDNTAEMIPLNMGSPDGIPYRTTNCLYQDPDGSIWVGTEVGLLNYNPVTGRRFSLSHSKDLIYPSEAVYSLLRDQYGELWVGTKGGLYRYNSNTTLLKCYTARSGDASSIISSTVNCLYEDSRGRLWIGTPAGLNRFDRESQAFSPVNYNHHKSMGGVNGIQEDNHGVLWISTSDGLVRYDSQNDSFRLFDESDGLAGRDSRRGAFVRGKDGGFVYGSDGGVNRFCPDSIHMTATAPTVYLEDFRIFNESVIPGEESCIDKAIGYTEEIHLTWRQSSLSFQFCSPDYVAPERMRYEYQLEGLNNEWTECEPGQHIVSFTNLHPGRYVFRVKACNRSGIWSDTPASVRMKISPPIWKQWWAFVLYALVALGIVLAAVTYFIRREERKHQEAMNQLRMTLFTNISHEFRTSLTLIIGPLNYLLQNDKDCEDRNLLTIMQRNAVRLHRLVNQLLDSRKVEEKGMTVNNTAQDMVSFLTDLSEAYGFHAREKGLDYSFQTSVERLEMAFDKDKVEKIVYNLLSNAFKYTEEGGRVVLSLKKEDPWVVISVEDNGVGISPEDQQSIFKRFYQVQEGRREGSGLGLNLSLELARIMGGSINVKSSLGTGSLFTFILPLVAPDGLGDQPGANYPPQQIELPGDKGSCVLVVDDNQDNLYYCNSVLSAHYTVETASCAREGLDKAIKIIPSLVLCDVMMPGEMDGMSLFKELRADERTSDIPFLLLTAVTDEHFISQCYHLGIDGYIGKPFNPELLLAKIANLISKYKSGSVWAEGLKAPLIERSEAFIREHLADKDLGVEMLAAGLGISEKQLGRNMKALIDMPPYGFIVKVRMETVVRLMKETDLNVSEIAFRCGYQEISNFSRAFSRYWGESPSTTMKKLRGKA